MVLNLDQDLALQAEGRATSGFTSLDAIALSMSTPWFMVNSFVFSRASSPARSHNELGDATGLSFDAPVWPSSPDDVKGSSPSEC